MNWLLVVLLAIMAGFVLWKRSGDFLSPGAIVVLMFFLSATLLAMNGARWQYRLRLNTVVVVVVSLLLFLGGELCARKLFAKYVRPRMRKERNLYTSNQVCLEIPKKWFVVLCALCILIASIQYIQLYRLSLELGNESGLAGIAAAIRPAVEQDRDAEQNSNLMKVLNAFNRAFSTICLFIFIQRVINRQKSSVKYILPVAYLMIGPFLTGSRGSLISTVAAVIFAVYYHLRKKNVRRKADHQKLLKMMFLCAGGAVAAFILLFWGIGFLVGKSKVLSFWDTFSIYIGSPILCFDALLNKEILIESQFFGQYTFGGIYNLVRRVIPSIPTLAAHLDKVRWAGGYSSNIYSSFFPYYVDFGVVGLFVMEMLMGCLIGLSWKFFNACKNKSTFVIYYGGTVGYACAMYPIAERLCSNSLALNVFVEWFFAIVLVWFVVEPYRRTIPQLEKQMDKLKALVSHVTSKYKN